MESKASTNAKRPLLVGGDISALAAIEEHGGVYRDDGKPGDAIEIMARHGHNCFRLRLFVNPTGKGVVVNDLPYTIALARRVKAAGAQLLLDFHYSDHWADPGQQAKPKAWQNLDFEALVSKVHDYTRDTIATMDKEGVAPDLVQIGNEIAPGMLWPDGKNYGPGDDEQRWDRFARLLTAGSQGVKAGAPDRDIRIVIHIHCGGDAAKTKSFFEQVERRKVPYDIIGLSFYPWWHGDLDDLRQNLRATSQTFDKDIFIVETAYTWRPFGASAKDKYKQENMKHPSTPKGQATFVRDLLQTVRETPNNHGLGIQWWYPESIPTKGLRIWHNGSTALFDQNGNALPALRALGE